MTEHTLTLGLREATAEQLKHSLDEAKDRARRCEEQGSYWHTWTSRALTIQGELDRRRDEPRDQGPPMSPGFGQPGAETGEEG